MGLLVDWSCWGRISEPGDISIEFPKAKKQREQILKTIQNIQGLWDYYKRCDIYVMVILEGEEREKQKLFETIMVNKKINVKHQIKDQEKNPERIQEEITPYL